jgi:PKHD-type hydroxylase
MLLRIEGLIPASEVARIREVLATANFADGKLTAGEAVRAIKNNLQVTEREEKVDSCRQSILNALLAQEAFKLHVLPKRVLPPMFNRYDVGMEYGSHVDNAIMGGADPVRADMSLTVFLSDPAEYEGGGLIIHSDRRGKPLKLPAGSAIIYNSSTIHRVEPVTKGSRYAAVSWVQSFVRDENKRDVLAELAQLARWARRTAPGSEEAMRIAKLRANLMRMWSEI